MRNFSGFSVFRILFGLLLLGATIRFWSHGWIESLYLDPIFHFKFYGFEWVNCPPAFVLYTLFYLQAIGALCFALNVSPNYAIAAFFLSFTYVELIDVTPYLNHYYLVSVVSFLLIFYHYNTDDGAKGASNEWLLALLKLMFCMVYFYGGLAKLNSDWLLKAQPMHLWLIAKSDIPLIGSWLLDWKIAYFCSWFGCVFDLAVPFLLCNRRTTLFAYILLSIFHIATAILFPIGIFPWVMMVGTLLFFIPTRINFENFATHFSRIMIAPTFVMVLQLIMPLRQFIYPQNRLWTEQGFRFAWNIMLIEKRALIDFTIIDNETKTAKAVDLQHYLTKFQITMMGTQPDLILQFAHYLAKEEENIGLNNVKVTAECYVSLNGRTSQLYFDPALDLTRINDSFAPRSWLYPLAHE